MFYNFCRGVVNFIFHIIFRITVIGKENIPEEKGGYIIASNHVSNCDPPMVGIVFKGKYTFMAKDELFHINPVFTWLIKKLGAFPVKRGSKDTSGIDMALESLKSGRVFVIFPEGTRSKTGELGKPKSGVSLIAARAKVPVVPVYVGYGKKKFRRNVVVSVGKSISAENFDIDIEDKHAVHRISRLIMGEIATLKENAPDVV